MALVSGYLSRYAASSPRTSTEVPLLLWRALVSDPLTASRARWQGFAWVFTLLEISVGGSLLIGGQKVLVAKGAFAVYGQVYNTTWGINIHGGILLLLGCASAGCLAGPLVGHPEPRRGMKWVLRASGFYFAWATVMFMFAPFVPGGEFSLVAVLIWAALAFWPTALSFAPPPSYDHRDENALIRLALQKGVSAHVAAELAHAFYES